MLWWILRKARSSNEWERLRAVRTLSERTGKRVFGALADALSDESNSVRVAAVKGLVNAGGRQALEPLQRAVLDRDDSVSTEAERAIDALDASWSDLDGVNRTSALCVDVFARRRTEVSNAAARWLRHRFPPTAVEPLIATLGDKDTQLRRDATYALGKSADTRAVDALVALLKDFDLRSAALRSLGELGAAGPLLRTLEETEEPEDDLLRALDDCAPGWLEAIEARRYRLHCLEKLADPALNLHWPALDTASLRFEQISGWQKTEQAQRALLNIADSVLGPDAKHWSEPQETRRRERLFDICKFGEAGVEFLAEASSDPSPQKRHAAAGALACFLSGRAAELLAAMLADPDRDIRSTAAILLAESSQAFVVDALVHVLENGGSAAGEALFSLAQSRDRRSVTPVLEYLYAHPRVDSDEVDEAEFALRILTRGSSFTSDVLRWTLDSARLYVPSNLVKRQRIHLDALMEGTRRLCEETSPVTSNVLRLIAARPPVIVHKWEGEEVLSFEDQARTARAELDRRGDPPYSTEAYGAGDLAASELRLIQSAVYAARYWTTRLSHVVHWECLQFLAYELPSACVCRVIAVAMGSSRALTLDDLERYVQLLIRAGSGIPAADLKRVTWNHIGESWPKQYKRIIETAVEIRAKL